MIGTRTRSRTQAIRGNEPSILRQPLAQAQGFPPRVRTRSLARTLVTRPPFGVGLEDPVPWFTLLQEQVEIVHELFVSKMI